MTEVLMPRLDPGMQSGKIVEWLKKEGESVAKGQAIAVIEGEKTTFEVEAPESGKLSKILASVGDDVQVSHPIAIIGEPTRPESQTAPSHAVGQAKVELPAPTGQITPPGSRGERSVASPAARRLAQEYGVDLSKVVGTGPGGRISKEDILAATNRAIEPSLTASVVSKTRQPQIMRKTKLEGVRKAVAERLTFSARNVVPVTLTMDADASKLVRLKDEHHLSFSSFAVKAVAKALEKHPTMNSSIEGDEITTYSDVNVCVAINTEQGLVAPTVFDANRKSMREINGEIEELADKAKVNQLAVENLTGGTFTVTNLGACDVESFAPVINPPQCGILGLGRIAYKPYAAGDQISSRPITVLTLVFDHRIIDGLPAARFLQEVKKNLEDPETLI